MNMLARISAAAALALGAFVVAPGAQAVTMSCTSAATYTLSHAGATQCETGNDTNQINASYVLFGQTGWVLAEKNDGPDGDGAINFTDAPVNGTKSGTWGIDTLAGLTEIVITLKAGNGFGAFLLDLTVADPLSGTWASSKALSHASIYYRGVAQVIPLPASLVLLLGALGGLGFAARRRRMTAA